MSWPTDPSERVLISQRLSALDSCAVSDALDALGLAGVVTSLRPLTSDRRAAGRVLTVELGQATAAAPGRHLCTAAIEAAQQGDIILVAHQGRADCAGWGGNLSRAAARRGVVATIVHGAVRDIDESRSIGYPVFGTGATPRTARGRVQEYGWGEPVQIENLRVAAGDFVVADGSGVVFVAAEEVERVVETAEHIVRREASMADLIDQGVPVSEVMGASYESLLSRSRPASPG